ncbi:MAG: 23S rRNA pseudouridine(2604) synthase RluF, partial [Bacteroidia bacterium]|nr:23S rRNA pseudouridine(2604) synthase RluF [Bacteroidia bacterium]
MKEKNSNISAGIQVNKYISSSGYCSRREADAYIAQCRVTINNDIILLGARVHAGDVVTVDGEKIKVKTQNNIYIAFNKPVGITSTTDTQDKSNIISFINHPKRIFPIGRLDKDSEGLILLTNDGDIVNKILRTGNEHEKEYIVTVEKAITPDFVTRMASGLNILGEKTKPCKVQQLGGKKFKIILTQGLNRQIRRMCEALNYHVTSLKRIRIMSIHLTDIPTGKWRNLSLVEMEQLQKQLLTSNKTEKTIVAKPKKTNKIFDPNKHEVAQYEQKPKPTKKIAP